MASSAAARFAVRGLRADERALVRAAGGVFALASGGAAMAAAAADGLFLAEVGRGRLGVALAISSALLAGVLAIAGGVADRLERRRVLGGLALASAVLLALLATLVVAFPAAVAWTTYIGGKQLAAATDLAFWVAIAERVDARRSPRVLPLLAALGGVGAALGAALVMPLANVAGTRGVLLGSAVLLVLASAGSAWLGADASRAAPIVPGVAARGAGRWLAAAGRAWRDGARAVRRYPLAAHLASLVAVAGVFGSLAYMALGFAVAARGGDAGELASLFGGVRAVGQLLTLLAQLALASRLLAWLGTGRTLLVAPLVALASGIGLVAAPVLAVAVAAQIAARVFDAGIETPAEKVALTLLPTSVRGRVGGFLDGPAKRAGAVIGGVLAAALAGVPAAFYASVAMFGALWALAAGRIARELPALAIEHVAGEADARTADDALGLGGVVDDRAIAALVRELAGEGSERAAELLARLHALGRVDAVGPLVDAAARTGSPAMWRVLVGTLATPAPAHASTLLAAARGAGPRVRVLAIRALGLVGGISADALAEWRESATGDGEPLAQGAPVEHVAVRLVADVAGLRLAGDRAELRAVLLDASRDLEIAGIVLDELVVELACALAASHAADTRPSVRSPDPSVRLPDPSVRSLDPSVRSPDPSVRSPDPSVRSPDPSVRSPDPNVRSPDDDVLVAARGVVRSLVRGAGNMAGRAAAFALLGRAMRPLRGLANGELALLRASLLELVRDRVDASASAPAPEHALVSLMRVRPAGSALATGGDPAIEIAAALRVLGVLLETAATIEQDDLRRLARALGEPDDDVRAAAEDAFAALGSAGAGELMATVAWGRRRARDRAATLLADLPVTAATLERLVDGELDALDQTAAALAVLAAPSNEPDAGLVARRLEERLHEIAHTVLLLVAAQRRSPAVAKAAVAWRHARGAHERARTLAVIEAALPRVLVRRLVDAVDELSPAERAAAHVAAGRSLPSREAAVRAELTGRDRLARALVLHALARSEPAAGQRPRDDLALAAYRGAITEAAHVEALAASPSELMRRLARAVDTDPEGVTDMPTRVETLIALGKVPLLAALTTRQLADVAERARWVTAETNRVIVGAGDPIDALIVVADGELAVGDRRLGPGQVVDELACVAPVAAAADVTASRAARLVRLERVDFEELVDDVPGLAAAVCRALGERARRAEDAGYRSPLASRG